MMNSMDRELDQVRRKEMMRKAEAVRRARDLQTTNGTARTAVLLARVGKVLSTMGTRLQERGGIQENAPVRQRDADRGFVNMAQSH